ATSPYRSPTLVLAHAWPTSTGACSLRNPSPDLQSNSSCRPPPAGACRSDVFVSSRRLEGPLIVVFERVIARNETGTSSAVRRQGYLISQEARHRESQLQHHCLATLDSGRDTLRRRSGQSGGKEAKHCLYVHGQPGLRRTRRLRRGHPS